MIGIFMTKMINIGEMRWAWCIHVFVYIVLHMRNRSGGKCNATTTTCGCTTVRRMITVE